MVEVEQGDRVRVLFERSEPSLARPVVDRDDELVDGRPHRPQKLHDSLGRMSRDDDCRDRAHGMAGSGDERDGETAITEV